MHALVGTIATVYALHNEVRYISGVNAQIFYYLVIVTEDLWLKVDHAYLLHDVSDSCTMQKVNFFPGKVTVASYEDGKLCCC